MAILETPIALEPPGGGGQSIGETALQAADIIVSTTRAGTSGVIRVGTSSVVSHAALYIGNGEVIEAIGQGVVRHGLRSALSEDALAVAYRAPAMTDAIATRIIAFASAQIGAAYSVPGALRSADPIICRITSPREATFFCSQLVIEAFRRGGLPLAASPSQCVTPQEVVVIARRQLAYVGHLMGRATWFPVLSP
jgi:cell wall-associated NlpC family hydrolase